MTTRRWLAASHRLNWSTRARVHSGATTKLMIGISTNAKVIR